MAGEQVQDAPEWAGQRHRCLARSLSQPDRSARHTEVFDTAQRRFVARADEAPAYYLSTLSPQLPAREFAHLVPLRWAIESRLHHVLDTSMAEDASCIRRNLGVFVCLPACAIWR
jgi:hypothetical protein